MLILYIRLLITMMKKGSYFLIMQRRGLSFANDQKVLPLRLHRAIIISSSKIRSGSLVSSAIRQPHKIIG